MSPNVFSPFLEFGFELHVTFEERLRRTIDLSEAIEK